MGTRSITGLLPTYPRSTVRFRQQATFLIASATYPSFAYPAATDATGAFAIAVPVPDDGTVPYRIELPDGTAADLFLGVGAAITLEELLAGAFASSQNPDVLAILAQLVTDHASLTTTAHGGIVPSSRTLTINGTTFDLSADRAWTVGDVLTSGSYSDPSWITSLAWSKVSGTPTTRAGYGISDAQPLDSDLTAIAALGTTSYGRSFLTLADAAAGRTLLGLGTASTFDDTRYAVLAAANTFTAAQSITLDDSATAAVSTLLTLDHSSSGTPAASFGSRLLFNLESTTTPSQNAAAIDTIWTTATDATRTSAIVFNTVNAGGALAEKMRIGGANDLVFSSTVSTTLAGASFKLTETSTLASSTRTAFQLIIVGNGPSTSPTFAAVEGRVVSGSGAAWSAAAYNAFKAIIAHQANGGTVSVISCFENSISVSGGATAPAIYGVKLAAPTASGGSTITLAYGIFVAAQTAATTNYAIWTDGGRVQHKTGVATAIGMVVQGFTSQSANLQEWQDVSNNNLSSISENGYYMTRKVAVPADAELSSSELAFWFDATNGAGKFMIKAKTANGTVVTGSVALA